MHSGAWSVQAAITKYHRLAGFIHNRNVFLTVLQAGRVSARSGSSKGPLPGYGEPTSSPASSQGEGARELRWPSFIGALIPFMRFPPL